ncbi:FAD-binding protein [Polyangium sorediatum]|uniref:FAD-binding protein n=1 Tax=Polyangium sorediatum TaxID=889274 RepID=A0ABT6P1M9_9BACT|nr:FAD-binding protein [Polyangium sorediatum]MDI1434511.1 FAD-binding protein [Polyangium sorediatum]
MTTAPIHQPTFPPAEAPTNLLELPLDVKPTPRKRNVPGLPDEFEPLASGSSGEDELAARVHGVPRVDVRYDTSWSNWHNSLDVGGRVERQLTPSNAWTEASVKVPWWSGLIGMRALQRIVIEARDRRKRVRAFGGGWSLNNVAFIDEDLVNTSNLLDGLVFVDENRRTIPWMLDPNTTVDPGRLVLAQAGTRISTLHGWLESRRLSLPTCGASNGQTIIGAISTGTHGSAYGVGAMQDYVKGLHVIGQDGKSFWIERESGPPIVSQTFCASLSSTLRRDDDLFDAALVGFGCFGLIHGVLLEVAPMYLLERFVYQRDFDAAIKAALTLPLEDWETTAKALGLPSTERPYHFEIVLNPYRLGAGQKGAFVRVLYQRPVPPSGALPHSSRPDGTTLNSGELIGCISVISEGFSALVMGAALQHQMESIVAPTHGRGVLGTCSQHFGDTERTGRGISLEIGVPRARAADAVDLILQVTARKAFGAPIALRYVKASSALLAFTRFEDITCTLELPGLGSRTASEAHAMIFDLFARSDIPHAYHWGQGLPVNGAWVRQAFGPRLDRWLAARRAFLTTPEARWMFSNPMIESLGLMDPP